MALWQFSVLLVPRQRLRQVLGGVPAEVPEPVLASTDWWGARPLLAEDRVILDSMVPKRSSWAEDILCWGAEDGDRIDVVLEDGYVTEITLGIDVRKISETFLNNVIALSANWDCVIIGEDFRVIPPTRADLLSAVGTSQAARFLAEGEGLFGSM